MAKGLVLREAAWGGYLGKSSSLRRDRVMLLKAAGGRMRGLTERSRQEHNLSMHELGRADYRTHL